eukprot:235632-Rhodomonas_salina.1
MSGTELAAYAATSTGEVGPGLIQPGTAYAYAPNTDLLYDTTPAFLCSYHAIGTVCMPILWPYCVIFGPDLVYAVPLSVHAPANGISGTNLMPPLPTHAPPTACPVPPAACPVPT